MSNQNDHNKEGSIENPIDKDKVTDTPGILEYAHHVGSALIKPEDRGKLKSQSLSAMYAQTDLQLGQIRRQIELLAEEARIIQNRKEISEQIYNAKISFKPIVGHVYHLYQKEGDEHILSMLGPDDWGRSKPDWNFVSTVKLFGDYTWEILGDD
ncbi:MAG: hypothetical protein Salg2KO_20260 [Salibacteraceae bacterium]